MSAYDFHDDVGAYLLGALSPAEREAFEAEMERSPELRAEVEDLRFAAEALPASPIQLSPPPELKDRIMAVVNAEAELLRAAGPQADRPPAPRRRRFAFPSLRPALAAGMAALALAAVVTGALVAGGGETRVVVATVGDARLIEREGEHSTLEVRDLVPPAPGRVYQVWLQHEGAAAPTPTNALFSTRSDGTASVDVPGSLEDVEAVMVTSEPDGGSQAPTTEPVIVASPA